MVNQEREPGKEGAGLILTRKPEQGVVITHFSGDQMVVRVLDVERNRVRLGFKGSEAEFNVLREELVDREMLKSDETQGSTLEATDTPS